MIKNKFLEVITSFGLSVFWVRIIKFNKIMCRIKNRNVLSYLLDTHCLFSLCCDVCACAHFFRFV